MLIDELCGRLGLRLFILHDFDISGFSIKKTLVTRQPPLQVQAQDHRPHRSRAAARRRGAARRLEMPTSVASTRRSGRARPSPAHQRRDPNEIEFLLSGRRGRTERHDLGPVRRLRRAQAHRAWRDEGSAVEGDARRDVCGVQARGDGQRRSKLNWCGSTAQLSRRQPTLSAKCATGSNRTARRRWDDAVKAIMGGDGDEDEDEDEA